MGTFPLNLALLAAVPCALALAGCAGGGFGGFGSTQPPPDVSLSQPPSAPEIPASIRPSEIVGRWGYASFHNQSDRVRTEANARGQCRQPYVIGMGTSGGVMMHLADQSQVQELRLKGSPSGKNYIGPPGEAGGPQDREVIAFDGRVMLLSFVDPEVRGRYGTGVYVRCAPSPGGVAQRGKAK